MQGDRSCPLQECKTVSDSSITKSRAQQGVDLSFPAAPDGPQCDQQVRVESQLDGLLGDSLHRSATATAGNKLWHMHCRVFAALSLCQHRKDRSLHAGHRER